MERHLKKSLLVAGLVWLANNASKQALSSEEQAAVAGGAVFVALSFL